MKHQLAAFDTLDALEADTLHRLQEIYSSALISALKKKKKFLRTLEKVDSGEIQPPQFYVDNDRVEDWLRGFVTELARENAIIDSITQELARAGVQATDLIQGEMVTVYRTQSAAVAADLTAAAGVHIAPVAGSRRQVAILLQKQQSPFSKVAYSRLVDANAIRRDLQHQLAQSTILGEGQPKLVKRIMGAMSLEGQKGYRRAKRIAQTERTRVQSQAAYDGAQEAAAMGINIANKWTARMVRTRDTHAALNGTVKPLGEAFTTIAGNTLRYPGDPEAPAAEVVNCHCVMIPMVLLPGEEVPYAE